MIERHIHMKKSDSTLAKGNSRKTVEWIIENATKEFASHGLEGARIDRIAQAAGVTKRLVYHYFGSIQKLYVAALEQKSEAAFAEILAVDFDSLPPIQALRSLLEIIFDQYRSSPDLIKLLIDQNMQECVQAEDNRSLRRGGESLVAICARLIARGQASNELRKDIDLRKWLAFAFVTLTGCLTMGRTLAVVFGHDPTTPEALEEWRHEVISNLINTLKVPNPR